MGLRLCVLLSATSLLSACEPSIIGEGSVGPTARFPTPGGAITAQYEVRGDYALVGGDMLFPLSALVQAETLSIEAYSVEGAWTRWPDGVIPYASEPGYQYGAYLQHGVDAWNAVSEQTGVRFVPRTTESDYLYAVERTGGNTCSSGIGRQGGAQEIAVSCGASDAIHELGHALGLIHEMSRPDRDQYITVLWENIPEGQQASYQPVQAVTRIWTPYDLRSIMHYPAQNDDGTLSFVGREESEALATYSTISALDIAGVAGMYAESPAPEDGTTCEFTCQEAGMHVGDCALRDIGAFACMPSGCLERVTSCREDRSSTASSCQRSGQAAVGQCVQASTTTCYGPFSAAGCAGPDEGCCFVGSLECPNSNLLLSPSQACDGRVDCPQGEDEQGCDPAPVEPSPQPPAPGPPTTDPKWGACNVGGTAGTCIDTATDSCGGTLNTGLCPGPSQILCCTP